MRVSSFFCRGLVSALLAAACAAGAQEFGERADAWFHAARCGDAATLESLLGEFPVDVQDCEGNTALMWAVKGDDLPLVVLLVKWGADPGKQSGRGATPLGLAVFRGDPEIVRALLARGEEPDSRGQLDATPLMRASRAGRADLVTILLDAGAEVDARNRDGVTPLMLAAGVGRAEVVRTLLRYGADPALRSARGLSALDYANLAKEKESAKVLKDALTERARAGAGWVLPPAEPDPVRSDQGAAPPVPRGQGSPPHSARAPQ